MKRLIPTAVLLWAPAARAADGRLVVEVVTEGGRHCTANVEVRQAGRSDVVKSFVAEGGESGTGLAPGEYDVVCRVQTGGLEGTKRVTIESGKTARYVITVKPGAAPAPASGPGSLRGKVKLKNGSPMAKGKARVILEVGIDDGAFAVEGLKAGAYKIEILDAKGKKKADRAATVPAGGREDVEIKLK